MLKNREKIKILLWDRDGDRCGICGESLTLMESEVDHIIPSKKGGTDELCNLQLSHRPCNLGKGNRILDGLRPRPIKKVRAITPERVQRIYDETSVLDTEQIVVRVTPGMKKKVEAYCRENGISIAEAVRCWALGLPKIKEEEEQSST